MWQTQNPVQAHIACSLPELVALCSEARCSNKHRRSHGKAQKQQTLRLTLLLRLRGAASPAVAPAAANLLRRRGTRRAAQPLLRCDARGGRFRCRG